MHTLLQRVKYARVIVGGEVVGQIGRGFLALVCAERGDSEREADKLLAKILKLRVFSDDHGKMNHSLSDIDGRGSLGGLLLVSQFTLAAETGAGNRPSFTAAAPPEQGQHLYDYLVVQARAKHPIVQTGIFAADMQVELCNDGPVTIPIRVIP